MSSSTVAASRRPRLGRLRVALLTGHVLGALAAFFGALVIYFPTLSPSVVPGDGGELQALTGVMGISHPTGYPLLLMLSRLFSWLPLGGDLAYRVTLLGTLFTAGAVLGLYLMLREVGARPVAALAGAWLMAAMPRVWMHAAAAEVYPLSQLLLAMSLWLLIRWRNGRVPLWVPALALGFALSHHVSIRLFGPAVLVFLLTVNPRLPIEPRKWLPALVALLVPLLAYIYLPLRFAHFSSLPEYAGEVLGIPKLIAGGLVNPHYYGQGPVGIFLASSYSGFFEGGLAIGAPAARDFLRMLGLQFSLLAAPVMLVGLAVLLRKHWRVALLILLGGLVTLLVALRWLTIIGEDGDHFIPVYMLLAFCFGVGVDAVLAWVARRLPGKNEALILCAVVILALPLYGATRTFPAMLATRQYRVSTLLTPALPTGAVIAGDWHDITPLRYEQLIEGNRPDLWVFHADASGIQLLAHRALDEGRPFYELRSGASGLELLPIPLIDEAAITHPASPDQQQMSDSVLWRGYSLSKALVHPGEVLGIKLYWEVLKPVEGEWTTFIHLVGDDGMPVAQVDREPVGAQFGLSQWRPGLLIADPYELIVPLDVEPGRYRLVFGWYRGEERLMWLNGQKSQFLADVEVRR